MNSTIEERDEIIPFGTSNGISRIHNEANKYQLAQSQERRTARLNSLPPAETAPANPTDPSEGKSLAKACHIAGIKTIDNAQQKMADFKKRHCRERANRLVPITVQPMSNKAKHFLAATCFLVGGGIFTFAGFSGLSILIVLPGILVSGIVAWFGARLIQSWAANEYHAAFLRQIERREAQFLYYMKATNWLPTPIEKFSPFIPDQVKRDAEEITRRTGGKTQIDILSFDTDPYARATLENEILYFGHWDND